MEPKMTIQDALNTVLSKLDTLEVRGVQNFTTIIECTNLVRACLSAFEKPKEEPKITGFRALSDEEAKELGLEGGSEE